MSWDATKFYQGRKEALYGPPYTITIGIPLNSSMYSTSDAVAEQNLFLNLMEEKAVSITDLVGSSKCLAVMINDGSKVESLAWNAAHLKLLKMQNKKTKVISIH